MSDEDVRTILRAVEAGEDRWEELVSADARGELMPAVVGDPWYTAIQVAALVPMRERDRGLVVLRDVTSAVTDLGQPLRTSVERLLTPTCSAAWCVSSAWRLAMWTHCCGFATSDGALLTIGFVEIDDDPRRMTNLAGDQHRPSKSDVVPSDAWPDLGSWTWRRSERASKASARRISKWMTTASRTKVQIPVARVPEVFSLLGDASSWTAAAAAAGKLKWLTPKRLVRPVRSWQAQF